MKAPVGIDAWWIWDFNRFHIGFDIGIICRYHTYRLAITQADFTKGIKMHSHDRYYEPEDDNSGDLIEERMAELMKGDYSPDKYSNFAEAINEADKENAKAVEAILQQADIDYTALGRKLYCMAYEYMERISENHAQEDYASGYLND